jgi:Rrf2 family protein
MISQRARYAFKIMVALARAPSAEGLNIRQLCAQEKLPRKFTEQILSALRVAGYIRSRRGRDGGYELLKPADLIHIGPLLRLADGPIAPLTCLSRTAYQKCGDCRSETHCELRLSFDKPYAEYLAQLESQTLAQVIAQSDAKAAESRSGSATINSVSS